MTLLKLNEIDPHHRRTVKGKDVRRFQIYSDQGQPIGAVVDALLDETGRFYYLIADLQWPKHLRQVLIPLRETRVALEENRIYLTGLTDAQIEQLPAYSPSRTYRSDNMKDSQTSKSSSVETTQSVEATQSTVYSDLMLEYSAPLETSMPLESLTRLEAQIVKVANPVTTLVTAQSTSATIQEPAPSPKVVDHPPRDVVAEETIQLLEERLFVDRHKRKVGDVIVRKVIETQIVEIPIRREKLIVEQISPEYKQLASIDLAGGEIDGLDMAEIQASVASTQLSSAQVASPQPPTQLASDQSTTFPAIPSQLTIEAAIEFLKTVATQPNANNKRVQIQLTNQ